jgi:hypothetical protein
MPFAADITPERLVNADREPGNWLMNHRTYDAQGYSPVDKINRGNVKNLKLAYAVALGGTAAKAGTEISTAAQATRAVRHNVWRSERMYSSPLYLTCQRPRKRTISNPRPCGDAPLSPSMTCLIVSRAPVAQSRMERPQEQPRHPGCADSQSEHEQHRLVAHLTQFGRELVTPPRDRAQPR